MTLLLKNWKTPATAYPKSKIGKAEIVKWRKGGKETYFFGEFVNAVDFYRHAKRVTITGLEIGGKVWMSDDWPYVTGLNSFAERSAGDVLVGGLGLGLVVHALVRNPEVKKITVLEIEPDVIKLVGPLLPKDDRIKIVEDDFYPFLKGDLVRRDAVIWDLGVWEGEDDPGIGRHEQLIIPALCWAQYGDQVKVFRHGFDRDPVGDAFVHENPEVVKSTLRSLTLGRRA